MQSGFNQPNEFLDCVKANLCEQGFWIILVQMGEDYEVPGKDDSSNSSSSVYLEV